MTTGSHEAETAATPPGAGGTSVAIDPRTVLDDLEAGRLRAAEPDPAAPTAGGSGPR